MGGSMPPGAALTAYYVFDSAVLKAEGGRELEQIKPVM